MSFLKTILLSALISVTHAADYQMSSLPRVAVEYQLYQFSIRSRDPITISALPEHSKIFWLSKKQGRIQTSAAREDYKVDIQLIATSTGIVQFPPIPTIIGKESILIQLEELKVRPNPVPEETSSLRLLWNGKPETPEHVYIGQTFELTLEATFLRSQRRSTASNPARNLDGADWHVFTPEPGIKPHPSDYLYPFGRANRHHGIHGPQFVNPRFRPRYIRYKSVEPPEPKYSTLQYRARFTVGSTDRLKGHFHYSLTVPTTGRRVALATVDIPVKSIPPLPHETAIDTGLIGDWIVHNNSTPKLLAVQRPFKIQFGISGQGNPTLLKPIDFSAPGFSTITLNAQHLNESDRLSELRTIRFSQELLPSGDAPVFPAKTLATFNPDIDDWVLHEVNKPISLAGLSESVAATTKFLPATDLGRRFQRPVLLNLPTLTFPLIALAPLLPFLARAAKRRLDQRDPERDARKVEFDALLSQLQNSDASLDLIDEKVLPFLRSQLELPTGATTGEVAGSLNSEHPELANLLKKHSESSFSAQKFEIDLKTLATHLAKITFLCLLFLAPLRGATLEEANTAFSEERYRTAAEQYEALIEESSGHPDLYLNLAKARLSSDQPARARAACHTALLLDPLNSEGRQLMDQILQRLGQPALPGTQLVALRPDQFLYIAAWLWAATFALIGARRLTPIPRWPAWTCLALSLLLTGIGLWRNKHAYKPDQFMVLAKELPREPKAGTPNWDYPALRTGEIIQISDTTKTHGQVVMSDSSFWLPLDQLQQVW